MITASVALAQVLAIAPATADGAEPTSADASTIPDAPTSADASTPATRRTMLLWADPAAGDDARWATRVRRVQAELEALGIATVLFVPPAGRGSTADIAEEMAPHGARIAIWIAADRDRAELWRREATRLEHVAIVTGEDAGDADDTTFAVRVAEVATALSTEVEIPEASARPAVLAPIPPVPRAPPAPRWDVRAGIDAGGASRNVGALFGPVLGVGVRLGRGRRLGLDAEFTATALSGRVSGQGGDARVGWFAARTHVGVWPVPRARVSPMLGLGGGLLVAWTRGDAVAPFRGRSDRTATGLVSAMFDLAVRVSPRLRIRPGARVGVALPPIVVDTEDRTHRTAVPVVEGVLTLEWAQVARGRR